MGHDTLGRALHGMDGPYPSRSYMPITWPFFLNPVSTPRVMCGSRLVGSWWISLLTGGIRAKIEATTTHDISRHSVPPTRTETD
jgi:hypothetical protein